MITFFNLFFVPLVSIFVFYRRNNMILKPDFGFFRLYALFSIAVSIVTFLFMKLLTITTGLGATLESQVYTIVASGIAFLLPYIFEIYSKYIDIRFEVKGKDENVEKDS